MKATEKQVGGNHYKSFKIQPYEFFIKNQLPFHKADIIKRIMRYDLPGGKGLQDLEKIKHEIDLIIEFERWKTRRQPVNYRDICLNCQISQCDEDDPGCKYRAGGSAMQKWYVKLKQDPVRHATQKKKWHEDYLKRKNQNELQNNRI